MIIEELTASLRFLARLCFLCVLCDSVVSSSFLRAATPREELLRLVPDSVGFCLVVQDLRGHAAALQASPFVEQLSQSSLAGKIRNSEHLKKLDRFEAKMKDKLGLDWTRLRDDILGDALVLAYRPGPPGKPEQEQGVMLLRARNEKILAELIERLNKLQKEEGELKDLEERRHNGAVYFRRLEFDKRTERDKPPTFYYVHGAVLALSSQESMLRQVMDLDRRDAGPTEVARRLRELDAERALVAMCINPRAFDAEVDAKVAGSPPERSATVKHFARYWKALDSVVLSLSPTEQDINLSLGVRARVEEMPPAARRLFREAATASEAWRRFPESALLAAGGRIDGATLLEVFGGFLTTENRQALHATLNRQLAALLGEEDFARDVLPALGPDWGLCITAPAPNDKSWMPQTLFALRVDASRTKKALDRKLLGGLDFAARLLLLGHNTQHPDQPMVLKSGEVDGQEVRYLAGERGAASEMQPAYGLLHGYLLLASSVNVMTRFANAKPQAAAGSPIPLLRISCKGWRVYLRERREPIVRFLAARNKLRLDDAGRQLNGLLAELDFINRIELRQRAAPNQVIFTLSVQTAHALKK
ncbi:MAG TPA: hypothetical protein VMG10_17130 [Gemmataceae bacterium]|nr:hypothetical protein [Gemmataceae bacterium]